MRVMAIGGSVVQDGPLRNVNLDSEAAANMSSTHQSAQYGAKLH